MRRFPSGVQKKGVRPVTATYEHTAIAQVLPNRLGGGLSERDDPLFVALTGHADEHVVEIARRAVE